MSRSLVDLFHNYEGVASSSLPSNVEEKFKDDVTWRLSNNVDLKIKINRLCRESANPNCYEDSISTIYKLVKDNEICRQCPKAVSACPKDTPGYTYRARLDLSGTYIQADLCPCKYENERLDTLERITPCDKNALQVYQEATELHSLLKERGKTTLMETNGVIAKFKTLYTNFEELTSEPICYVLTTSADTSYSILPKVCSYLAYQFARKGKKVAYISEKEIFQNLSSPVDYHAESAVTRFNCAARRSVLIIEKVNELPYMNPETVSLYLLPLLKERNKAGRVTIFTSTDSEKPLGALMKRFAASHLSDGKNILRQSYVQLDIEDVLL